MGAAPSGVDSDSSVDAPPVPSVFIRIRHVLRQGQDALTQGVASVSAAAGDLAARMPRPDSRAAAETTTESSSAAASPARTAPAAQSRPSEPAPAPEPAAAPAAPQAAPAPSTKVRKKSRASAAPPRAAAAAEMDFLGLSDESAPATAAPPMPASASPEADLLGGDDSYAPAEASPPQPAEPSFAAVDDLDDFFQGGASEPVASSAQRQADMPSSRPAASKPSDLIGGMSAAAQEEETEMAGDVFLENAVAEARDACAMLSPDRASRVQQAIASAHEYVESRVVRGPGSSLCLHCRRL